MDVHSTSHSWLLVRPVFGGSGAWAPALLGLATACHPLGSLEGSDTAPTDEGVERIAVSPLDLDFGDVEFGDVVEQVFTIHNLGDTTVYVSGQGDPYGDAGFEVQAPAVAELAPGTDLDVTVRFSPTGDTLAEAQLLVAPADAVVRLAGLGRAPVLEVGDVNGPDVVLGCSGEGTIAVANAGSRTLSLYDATSTAAPFDVVSWPGALEPGQSGEVRFLFTPTAGGSAESAVVLTTSDPAGSTSVPVSALGYEGEGVTESFTFSPTNPTDILFVVDGSSIGPYASRVNGAAEAYVDALRAANVDFQLTAVSSGAPCPPSPAYAQRSDTALRASTVLSRAFAGGGGSLDDDLLALALESIDRSGSSGCLSGFRRADADLEIVVVALGPSGADVEGELARLQAGAGGVVRVDALVPTTGSCGTRADDYLAIASAVSGSGEDICESDWTSAFDTFAQLPGGVEAVRYPLAEVPVPSTLTVSVGGVLHTGWTLDEPSNELVFDSGDFALGAQVDIGYVAAVACE